jgi:probable HAF family extracellular repeat protein
MKPDCRRPLAAGLVAFALGLTACQQQTTAPDISQSQNVAATAAANYSVTDLGSLGGGGTEAHAINNAGQVVGSSQTAAGQTHAFLWKDGVMRDLGTLPGAAGGSRAFAVNGAGQVVGESATASGETHAFLWQNGVMRDLGTLGGDWSTARGINNNAQVVGWSRAAGGSIRAFIWEAGVMRRLAGMEKLYGRAWGINNAGVVVGEFKSPGATFRHAFRWKDGVVRDLGTLGGATSIALAIGGAKVVGTSTARAGWRGFLWESGRMTDLGTLGGTTAAVAINLEGQIVGNSTVDGSAHAFVWENGVMTDLGLGSATGINRGGWIIVNQDGRAVLLKPE